MNEARGPVSGQVPAESLRTAVSIADHELTRVIGRGAYGEVWLARHTKLGTLRAVKTVHRDQLTDAHPFQREFSGIQKYEPISRGHPNLVSILHVGGVEEYFYYVMELADDANAGQAFPRSDARNKARPVSALPPLSSTGKSIETPAPTYSPHTLRFELKQLGALPIDRCVHIGHALASALAYLHAHHLVHRDVKPSNVIFVGGAPKLADIGLVTGVDEARSFVGTEGYIPPEGPGTPSADCYSLGKLLYELSAGHDRTQWPEPPADLATRPDRERLLELNAILHKACAPELKQRYGDAEEMRAELALLQSGQSVKGKRAMERRWAMARRTALLVGMLLFLASGGLFLVRRLSDGYLHSTDAVNELVEEGNIALRSGTVERLGYARECFKKASAIDPEFVPAYFGLLRVFMAGNDNFSKEFSSELRSTTQKLIELAPSLAESRIATAYTKWFENRLQEGLADAKQATRMRAGSKEARGIAYDFYGCYLVNLGQIESASEQYQLAARIFPTEPVIEQHLGFPYFLKHDFPQALKHFRQATEKEPRYEGGHVWAGRVYEETGEFRKAIEEFEQADRLSGQDKGRAYYDDLRAAVDHNGGDGYWTQRLEEASRDPHLNAYKAAVCLARLGKREEAYKRLEEAVQKQQAATGNLVFDLCWDWNDEEFKTIAKRVLGQ